MLPAGLACLALALSAVPRASAGSLRHRSALGSEGSSQLRASADARHRRKSGYVSALDAEERAGLSAASHLELGRSQFVSAAGLELDLARGVGMCKNQMEAGKEPALIQHGWPSERGPPVTAPTFMKFIHVPRTGGSSVEDCARDQPRATDRWGVHNPLLNNLTEMNATAIWPPWGERGYGPDGTGFPARCFAQHVPPSLLDVGYYTEGETFCAVRNPYDRIISQLGFTEAFYLQTYKCNATELNRYVSTILPLLHLHPYYADCHHLPQAAFVYGWDPKKMAVDRQAKSCNNIMRYESLAEDFNKLMAKKGYPYRLSESSRNSETKSPSGCQVLTKDDLSIENRLLIENVYKEDFELFGYERLETGPGQNHGKPPRW